MKHTHVHTYAVTHFPQQLEPRKGNTHLLSPPPASLPPATCCRATQCQLLSFNWPSGGSWIQRRDIHQEMNSAIIRPSHRTTASCRRNQRGLRDAGGPTVGDEQSGRPLIEHTLSAWCYTQSVWATLTPK